MKSVLRIMTNRIKKIKMLKNVVHLLKIKFELYMCACLQLQNFSFEFEPLNK